MALLGYHHLQKPQQKRLVMKQMPKTVSLPAAKLLKLKYETCLSLTIVTHFAEKCLWWLQPTADYHFSAASASPYCPQGYLLPSVAGLACHRRNCNEVFPLYIVCRQYAHIAQRPLPVLG